MTFLDASTQRGFSDKEGVDGRDVTTPAPPSFSGLEWSVIALAERDRVSSLRVPGPIATALRTLFGAADDSRLSDDRLEALRRIAVLAWHHSYAVPVSELRAFLSAGFSIDQYEMLQSSIALGRVARRPRI